MVRVSPVGDGRGFAAEAGVALIADAANRGSKMKFAIITLPYSADTHKGGALLQAGLADWLREQGHGVAGPFHVKLTPDEEAAYGAWNKIGFANAHLARLVSEAVKEQAFPLLLESNCYGAIGALAGLQASAAPLSTARYDLDRRSRRFQHTGNDAEWYAEWYAERDVCRHCHRGMSASASQTGRT
jgi:hypothetical protein